MIEFLLFLILECLSDSNFQQPECWNLFDCVLIGQMIIAINYGTFILCIIGKIFVQKFVKKLSRIQKAHQIFVIIAFGTLQ